MYRKTKNNLIFLVSVLLFSGFTSHVFAIDFSNALKQSAQDTQTASSLFDGKTTVGNLYNQALKIVKQNETTATDQSVNKVVAYFTAKSCKITAQDVIHILYISNLGFKTFLDQQVMSSITSPWSLPTPASINESYFHFFACDGIKTPSTDDFTRVQNNLMALYYQSVNGVFYSSTLAQDNVGEDLFRNGTTDDSVFDLLVDISTIGNLFFSSFKQAPEVLFYRLPTADSGGGATEGLTPGLPSSPGNEGGTGGPSSDTGVDKAWVRGLGVPSSPAPLGAKTSSAVAGTTSAALTSPATVSKDVDVQQFLTTNNPSTFVQPNYSFLVGNACADVQKILPSQAAVQEITEDPQTYISGIVDFIEHANIQEVAETVLQSGFDAKFATAQKKDPATAADVIANDYAEIAFGEGSIGDGPCESACVALEGADQIKCQLGCAKSCIQNCSSLPLDDKILCVTDCTCKIVSGPKGAGWDKIEDMFSIKFCKEPVKAVSSPAKKIVSNIEGILTAISDALQGLKSSGQTIKMKKTKEFLDLGITLNLAELIDFKIFFAFKPIFAQKATAAQKRQQVIENKILVQATVGAAATPDAENYNKYVVVADIAANNALLQPVADADNAKAAFKALEQVSSLHNPVELYQQQKNALLSEDVIKFLQSHIAFRDQFFSVSTQMLLDATTLKRKIEEGK